MLRETLLALTLTAAVTCSPKHAFDNPERPEATPPPEAHRTFDVADLHEAMWRMARAVERVNVIFRRTDAPLTTAEQREIVSLLEEMEDVAARLAMDDARNLHPVLGENIDLFRMDLAASRKNASATPPNFFMAGTIAGSCAHCHGTAFGKVHSSAERPLSRSRRGDGDYRAGPLHEGRRQSRLPSTPLLRAP